MSVFFVFFFKLETAYDMRISDCSSDVCSSDLVLRARTIGRVPVPLAENYEGAAVSVEGGRTFLWLVADNNFNVWQRSLLLQFELAGLTTKRTPRSEERRVGNVCVSMCRSRLSRYLYKQKKTYISLLHYN